ncbi:MAG: heavy metal-associated domain-containing protein [Ginsengibacter sp.]
MTKKYFIEGMSCGSCVAKVKASILEVDGVESAEVQLQFPQATIKMESHIPISIFQSALNKAGYYEIHEGEKKLQLETKKTGSGCCC